MKIFLAGGVTGNLKPFAAKLVKNESVFSRGGGRLKCLSREFIKNMNLHLAGNAPWRSEGLYNEIILNKQPYILESFYYIDDTVRKLIPYFKDFLLDSGAFTFMANSKETNFEEYIEKYAEFINKNNIKHFFELDVDCIKGYDVVLKYRAKIEKITNKQCIPVWHKSRGMDEFVKMCQQYPYVAIGGIVTKEITPQEYKYFPQFIKIAHKYGAKIHGLGFTNLKGLTKYHFDSADSTSWLSGNRFGHIYKFNGKTMIKFDKQEGQRLSDSQKVALNNFNEWVKFQSYAERNL